MKKTQPVALGAIVLGWSALMMSHQPAMAQPPFDGPPEGPPPMNDDFRPAPPWDGNRPPMQGGFGGPRNGRPPFPPGPPGGELMRLPDLTPEQREKIRAIQEKTRRDIDAVLTPAQREQMRQMRERFGPPSGPMGRGPGGPDGRSFGPPPFDGPPPGAPFAGPFGEGPGGPGPGGPRGGLGGGPRGQFRGGPSMGRPSGRGPGGRGEIGDPLRPPFGPPPAPLGAMEWMLDLKPDQQRKIKEILNTAQRNETTVHSNTALDPEQRDAQLRSIHDQARRQVEAVLTPAQREKMQQSREQYGPPPRPRFDGTPRGGPGTGW